MYWLSRPPYARYALAACILVFAMWLDLRPDQAVPHPFAADDIPAGESVSEDSIEWRAIPVGLLRPVSLEGVLVNAVQVGDPFRESDFVSGGGPVPEGWWIIELDLPADVVPGQTLQLVVLADQGLEAPDPIPATVVAAGSRSGGLLGDGGPGRAAVPPDLAATAASAVADGRVSVLIGSRAEGD